MNQYPEATLDGMPLLSAKLIHRAGRRASELEVRALSSDLPRLTKSPRFHLSDGGNRLESSSLREISREDLGNGSARLVFRLQGREIESKEAGETLALGESLFTSLKGHTRRVSNHMQDVTSIRERSTSFSIVNLEKPETLVAMATKGMEFEAKGNWQAIARNDKGEWQGIDELLNELGIHHALFDDLVLHPEDSDKLGLEEAQAKRLLADAYRAHRFRGAMAQGSILGIKSVQHDGFTAPGKPSDKALRVEGAMRDASAALRFDEEGGAILVLDRIVAHLKAKANAEDTTTLHGFTVDKPARIEATLLIAQGEEEEVARLALLGEGSEESIALAPGTLPDHAEAMLQAYANALPTRLVLGEYAGIVEVAPRIHADVIYQADDRGMKTRVVEARGWRDELRELVTQAPIESSRAFSSALMPEEVTPKPQNAYRSGPIIIRDDANPDAKEATSFASIEEVDQSTGALAIENFGRLASPFWVDGAKPDESGAWFMAAPVKLLEDGVALLEDELSLDARFESLDKAEALGDKTKVPQGSDGLLLQGLDGKTHLALYDRALVAEQRALPFTDYSTSIREVSGHWLDPEREGALNLLTLVTLSPQALSAGAGRGIPSAWVPALNFRDAKTSTPSEAKRLGRGRFAESNGRQIGQLGHLPNQAGPIMADAASCTKHVIGKAAHAEGRFEECAGHIATDAFFKLAGDGEYDGPWNFQREQTSVGPGRGKEYRAEIKFDPSLMHRFQNKDVPGKWVVTYRLPIWDSIPPVWFPREDPPYIIDRNLHAPSYDWVPPPKEPPEPQNDEEEEEDEIERHDGIAQESDYLYPGAVVSSTGYAVHDARGVPRPELGGGVAIMPGGVFLNDGPDFEAKDEAQRWFLLHPQVGLGFGLPDMESDGGPRSGFRIRQQGETLSLDALDQEGEADEGASFELRVPLVLEAGFGGTAPSITGSRSDGSALASLLSALAALGLISNDTTA